MGRRTNLKSWVLIWVFVLAIVGTSVGNAETICQNAYQGTSGTNDTAQDPNGPTITSYRIITLHGLDHSFRDLYALDVSAKVYDPQGSNDIATVKVIDANGNEFILDQIVSGGYYRQHSYGSTPLPLGNTRIVAIDQSGNSYTISHNLTNIVEQVPTIIFPKENEVIFDTQPVFDWTDVTDEQSTITYIITVCHQDWTMIWWSEGYKESQVQFNFDDGATGALQHGMSYWCRVFALDSFGNQSLAQCSFKVCTIIDAPEILGFDMT